MRMDCGLRNADCGMRMRMRMHVHVRMRSHISGAHRALIIHRASREARRTNKGISGGVLKNREGYTEGGNTSNTYCII